MKNYILACILILFCAISSGAAQLQVSSIEVAQSEGNNVTTDVLLSESVAELSEETESLAKPIAGIDYDGLAPDIARIIERGKLIIAQPSADTPLFYESDGQGGVMGFDANIAKALAESLGVEAEFDRSSESFSELTDKLKRGEADLIISTFSMTTERVMYINFSDPYLETYLSILVNKQELVRNNLEANPLDYLKTNPVKIGAEANTAHFEIAGELFPNAEIVPCKSYVEGCNKVASSELFAFLSIDLAFLQALESDPTLSIYTSVFTFTDLRDQFCIAVSRDNPQLLNYVNAYLRTARLVTYDDISKAYKERYGVK